MSNFTPLVTKEYEFQGDQVTAQFARLKRKDIVNLLPKAKLARQGIADVDDISDEQASEVFGLFESIDTTEYVKSITGVKDSDGNAVDTETIMSEGYFMVLAMQILTDLFVESLPVSNEGKV